MQCNGAWIRFLDIVYVTAAFARLLNVHVHFKCMRSMRLWLVNSTTYNTHALKQEVVWPCALLLCTGPRYHFSITLINFVIFFFVCCSILLFPPLNNYKRFLIHKACEKFSELGTFSVGQGSNRRVAVYSRSNVKFYPVDEATPFESPATRLNSTKSHFWYSIDKIK